MPRGAASRSARGPWLKRRVRGQRRADHQGASGRVVRRLGGDRGGLERRLDDRKAGGRGIGEGQRDRAVVVELHDAGDRHERRIEAAGARGDDDVAALERVAADFERTDVDRPVAAALRDDRNAVAEQPGGNDVGAVGDQQHARGERAGVDDPPDEAVGRPHRHPDLHAVARRRPTGSRSAAGC